MAGTVQASPLVNDTEKLMEGWFTGEVNAAKPAPPVVPVYLEGSKTTITYTFLVYGLLYFATGLAAACSIDRTRADVYYLQQDSLDSPPVIKTSNTAFAPPIIVIVAIFGAAAFMLLYGTCLEAWVVNRCFLKGRHAHRWIEAVFVNTLMWLAAAYELGVRTEIALGFVAALTVLTWTMFGVVEYVCFAGAGVGPWMRAGLLVPTIAVWSIDVILISLQLHWSTDLHSFLGASNAYAAGIIVPLVLFDAILILLAVVRLMYASTPKEALSDKSIFRRAIFLEVSLLFIQRSIVFWVIIGRLYM
jgi:hypothetical protein